MTQPYSTGQPDDPIIIRRTTSFGPTSPQLGRVTLVLIGICVAVAIWSRLGRDESVLERLFISDNDQGLPEIFHGEVWRLVTPIFIHFNFLHIVFNMMWLKDLGTVIERRLGPGTLIALVLVIGACSDLAQYYFAGPAFGGMSGVVYGLLGFLWMKAKVDPAMGFRLSGQTVAIMLGWLVLCFTGLLGPVANYAHLGGLLVGIFWGLGAPRAGGPPDEISLA